MKAHNTNERFDLGYEFGIFQLFPNERLLLKVGERTGLRGKDFDVLVCLVENAGRLVGRDQLMDQVWKDAFVEVGNVATSISKVRLTLNDKSRKPKYIESVWGYGYRFLAEVTVISRGKPVTLDTTNQMRSGSVV